MEASFYLKAHKTLSKKPGHPDVIVEGLAVREYFRAVGEKVVLGSTGGPKPALVVDEIVDASIIAQHPREYAEFQALLAEQRDALVEKAKQSPGVAVFPEPKVEAPKPKKVDAPADKKGK